MEEPARKKLSEHHDHKGKKRPDNPPVGLAAVKIVEWP
jgi:hypothetical protein